MAKKLPERKCMGCMTTREKSSLVRIVRTPSGETVLDTTGKLAGRGAYLCKDPDCLKKAIKAKRLERSLKCEIPGEIYDRLLLEIETEGKNAE